jgi:hypothetical protein
MTKPMLVIGVAMLAGAAGDAQSAAEQLQKGIYAQETAGDVDGAIQIFRQVANSPNKTVAAQAQYQLVLCMLQRGDRAGASKEVETLARNFPDQADLITKARKLLPGGLALAPVPWPATEGLQLNIKRDGAATGEYLYYSVDPGRNRFNQRDLVPNHQWLRWELNTKTSRRVNRLEVDETTGEAVGAALESTDYIGDPAAEELAGPAIDEQGSVFVLRRLPLAPGYRTTLHTLPFTLASLTQKDVELSVTGIETVETAAGKFKCYKVAFAPIGQTFWIGVEGSRPLVKLKIGGVEAELVKTWGPENFVETELAFFRDAGWTLESVKIGPGPRASAEVRLNVVRPGDRQPTTIRGISVEAQKIYTPPAEIEVTLQADVSKDCEPASISRRVIGGQQSISCVAQGEYRIWIRTEDAVIHLHGHGDNTMGVYRWEIDRVLAAAKRIP